MRIISKLRFFFNELRGQRQGAMAHADRVAACTRAARALAPAVVGATAPDPSVIDAMRGHFALSAGEAALVVRACFRPGGMGSNPVVPLSTDGDGINIQDQWLLAIAIAYHIPPDHALEMLEPESKDQVLRMAMQNRGAKQRNLGILDQEGALPVSILMTSLAATLVAGGDPSVGREGRETTPWGAAGSPVPTPTATTEG